MILMLLGTMALGQKNQLIPFDEILAIANRNATALWGDVYPAEPIPYYGIDDEIVAWRFNYSIGKPFPAKEELLLQIQNFEIVKDSYKQWGGDKFGRILIGARANMPVLLEYSKCLSAEYALGNKLNQLINEAFQGKNASNGKIYYLNHFNTWHQVISENTTKYVCTSPTGGILDTIHFYEKKAQSEIFCETGDFSKLWNSYKNGFVAPTDGDKYIPYHECMPFYDWSFGCSPTAAAMLFAWYDYRSLFVTSKYPYFVGWHYQRFDNVENETDYNVCNLQLDLALAMSTDTMTGSTQSYNIDDGMSWVANHQRGYNFDIVNRYTLLWTRLTDDIDAGKPLIVSIPGHSTTGVGYNGSTDMAITHYTHDPPNHLVWVSRWDIDMITRVSSGGQKGSAIQLTRPVGDQLYNHNGNGEVYSAGNYAEITWLSDYVPGSWVDLLYSTDGGHSFETIVSGTENDGLYNWLIPAGISSTSCRVIANLRTPDMEPYIAGADGSRGNFIINNAGPVQTMVNEHIYSCDSLSGYYHFQHTDPSWAAIGAKSDFGNCNWEIQFFNNTNFNQTPITYSTFAGVTNFMVVDGNHYPSTLRGIKIRPLADDLPVNLEYEGGNENLTTGTNGPYNWNASEIVEMKDIHLAPGRYYFELVITSGWPDLGMALFGSADGQYLKRRYEYLAFSDYSTGSQTESFNVTITQEDDYGLCIFSNRREAGNYTIKISDAFIWTGVVSSDWHNPDNWSGHLIPDISANVIITGDGFHPHISGGDASCGKMNILHDGRLYIDGRNLTINGDLTLNGWLLTTNSASRIACYGNLVANQYSYLELASNSGINAYGNWTFEENTNIQLNQGFVDFKGTGNSTIYSKSENSWFYDLKVSKTGGGWTAYDNCTAIEPLHIKNQFVLYDGAIFIQYAMYDVIFDGPFLSYAGSHFYFQNGTVRFEREGTGGISIFSESGSYFNNVVISVDDWLGLSSDIEIRGDLLIEDGMFKTLGYDVFIRGDWYNNSGFDHDNARVIFNGSGIQEVTGSNFWELELNKTSGELRVHESTVSVQHYNWTQGTVRVNGGWFQLNDLIDPGIYGTVILTSGQLDVHQETDEYLDLNGNLQISGGAMNIYGGNGDSYWPFSANASFTMSDGVLDFKTNGLRINNSATYSLTENITGGIIKIYGNLTVTRTDFNPAGGTILFYGYTDDATVSVANGSNLFNLELDKSSKGPKALAKTLTASGTLDLNGDFIITGGNFEAPAKMYIAGNFINTQTHWNFDELTGEVILDGAVDQVFNQDETFYKLTINKPGNGTVSVENGVTFTALNTLFVDRGNLVFEEGSTLFLDGNFDADYLGSVFFYGMSGSEISVTSASKSNFGFDISAGGYISARNTIFSNTDVDGVYLHSGAYVDPENAFTDCTFSNGAPGGTLITWDNGAEVVVHHAVFPANATGCTFNVKKTTNNGRVFFDEASGPFAGAAFESDPFSRIDWEYIPPLTLPFNETWATSSYETQHWVPEGTNWLISGAWGNPLPSAYFHFYPRLYNYSVPLRSHLLDGSEVSDIHLKYDIRYVNYSSATLEQFKVQAVLQNGDFVTLATYSNAGGTFGFITEEFDISAFADGEIFYLRFTALGADTWNTDGWFIDNIQVSGTPPEPGKLNGFVKDAITDQPISGAAIQLDGTPYSAISQINGEYTIAAILPGIYTALISKDNYEPETVTGIEIISGETALKNFYLTLIPPTYCTQALYTAGCAEGDGLNSFRLGSINNTESGCSSGGYGDFSAMTTSLSRGYPYALSVSSNFNNQNVSVWIDLNNDFIFTESERLITDFNLSTSGEIYTTALYIPEDAPTGTHRLRARTNWSDPCTDPCATYDYGEVEDYTVEIANTTVFGDIMVFVTDEMSKGVVENARVEVVGTSWLGFTEEEGFAIINDVDPGLYDLLITAENYEDYLLTGQFVYPDLLLSCSVVLTPLFPLTHSISLSTGWQGLSSYLIPGNDNTENIFEPIHDELVIASNFDGIYWPEMTINTIGTWNEHDAFCVKVSSNVELQISGYNETNKTVPLNEGWTMMPVACQTPVSVEDLIIPALSNIVIVKEIAGTGVYWPEMAINSLIQVDPGKAYLVLTDAECSVTFPENPETKTPSYQPVIIPLPSDWARPVATPSSHIIAFPADIWAGFNLENGNIIGAFTNDSICAGSTLISEKMTLSVFADDPLTQETEGFIPDEKMNFRISTGSEIKEIGFTFDPAFPDYSGTFVENGISVVRAVLNVGIPQTDCNNWEPVIYPNPGNGIFNISGIDETTQVIVWNNKGQEIVATRLNPSKKQLDLGWVPGGIYFVSFFTEAGVYQKKIVICK